MNCMSVTGYYAMIQAGRHGISFGRIINVGSNKNKKRVDSVVPHHFLKRKRVSVKCNCIYKGFSGTCLGNKEYIDNLFPTNTFINSFCTSHMCVPDTSVKVRKTLFSFIKPRRK